MIKKIFSYNVNGIRAALNKGLINWISETNPDIICFQETKAQPEQIDNSVFEELGYNCYWYSAQKKGYSGVGIISKQKPDNVEYGMGIEKYDNEGRFLRADFGDISVISVYHPSGSSGDDRQAFKMQWLSDFHKYIKQLEKTRSKLIISGDYNICRLWIDIHNPEKQEKTSGFLPEEREWFQNFVDDGFTDSFRIFNEEPHNYSWWSYRAGARAKNKGWRIDYNILTNNIISKAKDAKIYPNALQSDHCPVSVEIEF
ncbi:MAG: exodeoxyribonuclease III [Bacteroidales bacterium]|nr:exodeoxyribonuclease III [Bacteroidales bacterium]MBN2756128.1 exodeoxyribonuclease III [Bacteroidales bacterium]